jgi:hypothetical protein
MPKNIHISLHTNHYIYNIKYEYIHNIKEQFHRTDKHSISIHNRLINIIQTIALYLQYSVSI